MTQCSKEIIDLLASNVSVVKYSSLKYEEKKACLERLTTQLFTVTSYPEIFESFCYQLVGGESLILLGSELNLHQKAGLLQQLLNCRNLYLQTLGNYSIIQMSRILNTVFEEKGRYQELVERLKFMNSLPSFIDAYYLALRTKLASSGYFEMQIFVIYLLKLTLERGKETTIIDLIKGAPKFTTEPNAIGSLFKEIEHAVNNQYHKVVDITPSSAINLTEQILEFVLSQVLTIGEKLTVLYQFYSACFFPSGRGELYKQYIEQRSKIIYGRICEIFRASRGSELDKAAQNKDIFEMLAHALEEEEWENYLLDLASVIENNWLKCALFEKVKFKTASVFPRLYTFIVLESNQEFRSLLMYKLAQNRPCAYLEETCLPHLLNNPDPRLCLIGLKLLHMKVLPTDFVWLNHLFLNNPSVEVQQSAIIIIGEIESSASANLLCSALKVEPLIHSACLTLRFSKNRSTQLVGLLFELLEKHKTNPRSVSRFSNQPTLLDLIVESILNQRGYDVLPFVRDRREPIYVEIKKRLQ